MMPARNPLARNRVSGADPLDLPQFQTQPNYVPIAPEEPFWTNYWLVLRKRKWVVLATLVVVVTLATIFSLRTQPIYDAFAKIEINQPNSDALLGFKDVGAGVSPDYYSDSQFELATQVNILQSGTIALQVIKALNLDSSAPEITGKPVIARPPDRSKEAGQISRFQASLHVVPLPETVVNTLVQTFTEENIKAKFDSTMQASEWLSKQLGDLQLRVETSQEKILRYQKENSMLGVNEKQNINTAKLDELNKKITAVESDRIQ